MIPVGKKECPNALTISVDFNCSTMKFSISSVIISFPSCLSRVPKNFKHRSRVNSSSDFTWLNCRLKQYLNPSLVHPTRFDKLLISKRMTNVKKLQLTMPASASLASYLNNCCNEFWTWRYSFWSSTINNWAKISLIRLTFSFESLHKFGNSLMAKRRIWISSSSHKSSDASIAFSVKFGKHLKNFGINVDAKRFSLSEPLVASTISKYSFSC